MGINLKLVRPMQQRHAIFFDIIFRITVRQPSVKKKKKKSKYKYLMT